MCRNANRKSENVSLVQMAEILPSISSPHKEYLKYMLAKNKIRTHRNLGWSSVLYLPMGLCKQCTPSQTRPIATDKALFSPKNVDIFLVSPWKHMLWVLIRSPSQHMFSWRNKKDILWIPPIICSYADLLSVVSDEHLHCSPVQCNCKTH